MKLDGVILKGRKGEYRVEKLLKTEALHSLSYVANELGSNNRRVFVKLPNFSFRSPHEMKSFLPKLRKKFQVEVESNGDRLRDVENIAQVVDWGTHNILLSSTSVEAPFLVQRFVDGTELAKYVMSHGEPDDHEFEGLRDPNLWLALAEGILEPLNQVHERGVVHADIHPGNILIDRDRGKPVLIDFGESFIRESRTHKRGEGTFALAFASPEKRGNKVKGYPEPWEAPSDIFAFAVVMYYLATGDLKMGDKIYERRDEPMRELHDLVHGEMLSRNSQLVNANACVIHVILLAIHPNPHERATARQLLDYVRIIKIAAAPGLESSRPSSLSSILFALARDLVFFEASAGSKLVSELLRVNVGRFGEKSRQLIHHGRIEMSGDRTEMLNHLQQFLAVMTKSDSYWSVTHSNFWSAENLGVKGRFYHLNRMLALKGVPIRRVFLVSIDDDGSARAFRNEVLHAQKELVTELEDKGINVRPDLDAKDGFFTGVTELRSSEVVEGYLRSGYLIGVAELGAEYYGLTFRTDGARRIVRRLSIERIAKPEWEEAKLGFVKLAKEGTNLADYPVGDRL